jgi:hypothetical protein
MLHLVPHLVTQRNARLWLCARAVEPALLSSVALKVNGIDVPLPANNWQSLPPDGGWRGSGAPVMPLHYQFIDKPTLAPDSPHVASASLGDGESTQASFVTLPEHLGDETKPLRVLLSSCYFSGNKRSTLAASLATQLDRNGLRPHFRIWAGDQVYLDAPWYEFTIKTHTVAELERLHSAAYARTWFAEQGLGTVLPNGANIFCTDDHDVWNNAPDPNAVARDTRKRETREAWLEMARELGRAFQGDTATAQRFSVAPLDFLVLDARINRTERCESLFSKNQWKQIRAWAGERAGLGVLVLGQPLFEAATRRRGNLADYHLADYQAEYAELMELLGRSSRSVAVLTGDVHFSRVAWASFPPRSTVSSVERRVTEFISSPLSMVAGGRWLSWLGDWSAAPAKASLPARHSCSGMSMHTDEGLISSAEGSMLLEFYQRGQRVFCTVTHWRLDDLERPRPFFRKDYFLGNLT